MGRNSRKSVKKDAIEVEAGNNKRPVTIESFLSLTAIVISVITLICTGVWHRQDMANQILIFSEETSFDIDYGSESFNFTLGIEQGGIKKAFWANISDSGIDYQNKKTLGTKNSVTLTGNLLPMYYNQDKGRLSKDEKVLFDSGNAGLKIQPFPEQALIIMDTTERWWIYYFIFSPEITPYNLEYDLSGISEDGTEVGSYVRELEKQNSKIVMIDGRITSVETIKNELERNGIDGSYYFFEESLEETGIDAGAITDSNPYIDNVYEIPDAEKIFKNIEKIHNDINSLQL